MCAETFCKYRTGFRTTQLVRQSPFTRRGKKMALPTICHFYRHVFGGSNFKKFRDRNCFFLTRFGMGTAQNDDVN